jgi:hypothetical protein
LAPRADDRGPTAPETLSQAIEIIDVADQLFRRQAGDETILVPTKPFWAFGAELRKRPMVINRANKDGAKRRQGQTGDSQMRITSFILAFAFVVAGSSMAGSAENGLPGIGTFSYNGSPVVASHSLVLAVR